MRTTCVMTASPCDVRFARIMEHTVRSTTSLAQRAKISLYKLLNLCYNQSIPKGLGKRYRDMKAQDRSVYFDAFQKNVF